MQQIMKKVLVADDKATSRELVRTVLENAAMRFSRRATVWKRCARAQELTPDLIILDLHMPGLDGFGVIQELRRDEQFAATPIMALTASAMQGDRERALSAGFHRLYHQADPLEQLREEVERLLINDQA